MREQFRFVARNDLVIVRRLGCRGNSILVRDSRHSDYLFVYKGVDFTIDLESGHVKFGLRRDVCYHEIRRIRRLPPHKHIIPPAGTLVIEPQDERLLICRTLVPHGKQDAADSTLAQAATWCSQMAAAVVHTRLVAKTYHMDIKPGNFLVDQDRNIPLIDWEQSGACLYTLAPEDDGSWDVAPDPSTESLTYVKYNNSPRRNLPWERPKWNVFPLWSEQYPHALDLAEIFSLGRTMWMLLNRIPEAQLDEEDDVTVQ
ncbi:MAG: hypothetical protein M1816_001728 [Peltula sp. TS41687]|nr:MAG: hypothetical protein M1816_001728 [Peltula sp. TS41687]